jgi:ppGpp synthetase/RelA/SpoT-type nucleotidyltranferase
MNLDADPPWSKNQLRKLGEALLEKCAPPDGCPDYGAVMLWHNDLAGEVASVISNTRWVNKPAGQFAVTARSKTVDTLVQKLQRSTLKLDRVQDLAGVRIDADLNLTQQTKLAEEIAHHFGDDRVTIKDIRQQPHSGYRAVHLWLVLPAGRAEVQIRTIYQSLWANAYEGIADLVGRGIRYDEKHEDSRVQQIVAKMHEMSAEIAHDEAIADQIDTVLNRLVGDWVNQTISGTAPPDPALIDQALHALTESGADLDFLTRLRQTADQLRELRRILDQ